MSARVVTLSCETLDRILEHVNATGQPLLRDWRPPDVGSVHAWQQERGSYELIDPDLNDFLNSCKSWERFAEYCDLEVHEVAAILRTNGYPWPLPVVPQKLQATTTKAGGGYGAWGVKEMGERAFLGLFRSVPDRPYGAVVISDVAFGEFNRAAWLDALLHPGLPRRHAAAQMMQRWEGSAAN